MIKAVDIAVKQRKDDGPLVSVIIPTFNSEKTLDVCLRSIRNQAYSSIEIILIDNYSTDDTVVIARKYNSKFVQRRALRSESRNYGAKIASGEFYFFVDSDMELFSNTIQEFVNRIKDDQSVGALIGSEWSKAEGFWGRCKALERELNIGYEVIEAPRFFTKDIFWKIGGYDSELEAGEDWDLFKRIQKVSKVSRVHSGWVHHEGKPTMKGLMARKYYYGKSMIKYIVKRRKDEKKALLEQCFLFRVEYLRKWRLLLREPKVTIGFVAMKILEFLMAGIGIIESYIRGKLLRGRTRNLLNVHGLKQ